MRLCVCVCVCVCVTKRVMWTEICSSLSTCVYVCVFVAWCQKGPQGTISAKGHPGNNQR